MPKLMTRVRERDWIRSRWNFIPGKPARQTRIIDTREIEAKLAGQTLIELDQFRGANRRRSNSLEEWFRQSGITVVERDHCDNISNRRTRVISVIGGNLSHSGTGPLI